MDFFQHRYYRKNKILLKIIGQWPYQTSGARSGLMIAAILISACQNIPQILALVKHRHDRDMLLECVCPLLFVAVCYAKFFSSTCNSQNMLRLLDRIRADWQVWSADAEVTILHEYAERGRKITTAYAVVVYSTGIFYITQPILPKVIDVLLKNGTEPVVFPFPVDYRHLDTQKYYLYIVAFTYVFVSWGLLITTALDVIVIVYVQHCCGIFAALGHRLERLGWSERGESEVDPAFDKRDTHFGHLVSCVDRHIDCIEYAKLIEKTYTWYFFCIVGFNVIGMSLTALQILRKTQDPQETVRFVAFIVCQIVHLYLESYMSQILMDHSINIGYHIQRSRWYTLSLQGQKLLNLMIVRCGAPCKLTVGKITVMSVETFGMVRTTVPSPFLKAAMSYLTILRSV